MSKIEEITALLIDEIASFQKSVEQLKKQTEGLEKHKVTIDVSQIKSVFKEYENKLNTNYKLEDNQLKVIQNKLNKTIIIPKWMIVLFISFFGILLISLGVNVYQYNNSNEKEKQAHLRGREELRNHIQVFFNDNPKTYQLYKKWKNKK